MSDTRSPARAGPPRSSTATVDLASASTTTSTGRWSRSPPTAGGRRSLSRAPWPCFGLVCVVITVVRGIGTWGNNNPVGWGWAITNFVFWIGIGHAGTLISAILFLLRQKWRTGIARFAEAMTIFAVICALQFPLIHTGRPWLAVLLAAAAARTTTTSG